MRRVLRVEESFMWKFVSFTEGEPQHNIVALGESVNASPEFDFIEGGLRLKQGMGGSSQT
jgi:hypothetical protein